MITQHAWMFLSSFEKLREKLQTKDTVNMVHLGARAFEEIGGEVVQTTSWVMRKGRVDGYKGTYCRLIEPTTQRGKEEMYLSEKNRYSAKQDNFSKIPGNSVAYWVSNKISEMYLSNKMLGQLADVRHGLSTGKNEWFVRAWSEIDWSKVDITITKREQISYTRAKWFPYNKGGEFRKWYGNADYVLWYDQQGQAKMKSISGHRHDGKDRYFQEGITWSFISSKNFGVRYTPTGFVFDVGGSSMFFDTDIVKYITGLLCSYLGTFFMSIQNPTLNFQVGNLKNVPVIIKHKETVDELVDFCIQLSKTDWNSFETSWDFQHHPLIPTQQMKAEWQESQFADLRMEKLGSLQWNYERWENECNDRFNQLKANEEELNRIFIDIYGLQEELTPEVEDKDVTVRKADLGRDIRSFISYAVGCMFGRYSLEQPGIVYAGGEWPPIDKAVGIREKNHPEADPNICSWTDAYGIYCPDEDNIIPITDEEYFPDDIVGRFVEFVKTVYGEATLEENLKFIADALGNKGDTSREVIRNYFLKDFYADHLKIYQKRPIYWLFDSGKQNGFKALIYMHRYDADTVGRVRTDYLHRAQKYVTTAMQSAQYTIESTSSASDKSKATKAVAKYTKQLAEMQLYDEAIAHIANRRIEIDLDDGVKVNYAKFQGVEVAQEGKKTVKIDLLSAIK
jgi:hypothetical protein